VLTQGHDAFNPDRARRSKSEKNAPLDTSGAEGGAMGAMTRTLAVLVLAGALGASFAEAGTINRREHRQRVRIAQGVGSGELTHREARRLRAEQVALRAEERLYRRTGSGLSRWERRDLHRDLNRTSRGVYRQKHDGQDR
jgi:hypothetical protein